MKFRWLWKVVVVDHHETKKEIHLHELVREIGVSLSDPFVKLIKCFHIKWSHTVFSSSSSLLKKLVFTLHLWGGELDCNKYLSTKNTMKSVKVLSLLGWLQMVQENGTKYEMIYFGNLMPNSVVNVLLHPVVFKSVNKILTSRIIVTKKVKMMWERWIGVSGCWCPSNETK